MPSCQPWHWEYSICSVPYFATLRYHSGGTWCTMEAKCLGREMPLRTLCLVLNAQGHVQKLHRRERAQLVLPGELFQKCLWGGPLICKIFSKMKQIQSTVLIILLKYFRSSAWLNYSALCPSNGLKPSMFIQYQIPLQARSTPHFKAKSNTKKLFIWNHSKSSDMLLSRFHWRL